MSTVAVVGAGYVGLTTAACFAEIGHRVVCADVLPDRIDQLSRGEIPILGAGLPELVRSGLDGAGSPSSSAPRPPQVVFGSRFNGEGRSMPASEWMGNRLLSLATNLLYNTSLSDMQCGYKLFTSDVLAGIGIESDRFDFEPEITAKVLRRGHRIYQVPVSYAGRPASEGRKFGWRDGLRALATLVRYRVADRR